MYQRVRFLKVLIEYPVTFDVDIDLLVQNHLNQNCIIVIRYSRHSDLKALGVFDRRSYIAAVFVLCPDILCDSLDCSYVFVGLLSVASVKDVTSRSKEFTLNFCVMGLLFWFCICPVCDRFERSPLPPLPAPLPAPLPPPLPYADFTRISLTSDMFVDACGCFDLNQLVRLRSA